MGPSARSTATSDPILIVEDEPAVLDFMRTALERTRAGDQREWQRIAEAHRADADGRIGRLISHAGATMRRADRRVNRPE